MGKTYTVQDVRDAFRQSMLAKEKERINHIVDSYIDEIIYDFILLPAMKDRCTYVRLELYDDGILNHKFSNNFTVDNEEKPFDMLFLMNFITDNDRLLLANILKESFERKGFSCRIQDQRIGLPLMGRINLWINGWVDKE